MTIRITQMAVAELDRLGTADERAGVGALHTERGNLPLDEIEVRAHVTGLAAETVLTQGFVNPHDVPLEATYVFPLPDRAAVTGMRMTAAGRVVEGVLKERQQAREEYDEAIRAGQRASIAEEERPDVFTMRVGNILPGERVTVRLTLAGAVPYEDGAATYRFPLVVAPRYVPGTPVEDAVGDGVAPDTDAVPDASRITPPVLLPGFPNRVRLGIRVRLDPAGLTLSEVRSSLHDVTAHTADGGTEIEVKPGERPDRDFVLRWRLDPASAAEDAADDTASGAGDAAGGAHGAAEDAAVAESLSVVPDTEGEGGTFQLTVVPPAAPELVPAKDVVLVLDRSGSMNGWKMAAARRAAARIVDSLTGADRFAVLAFDNTVDRPEGLGEDLVAATDRHRFRAVEFFAGLPARGGTELLAPLRDGLTLLDRHAEAEAGAEAGRGRVLVLVTDGQVGNEDQILRELAAPLGRIRVHTVGIDKAVNAGFLGRLAVAGGGRCELVESEDQLDEAMDRIHRRIAAPVVTGIGLDAPWLDPESVTPARLPDLFAGVPLRIMGRYAEAPGPVVVTGTGPDGTPWRTTVEPVTGDNRALAAVWARGRLRDLEDRYVSAAGEQRDRLERSIVDTSLRYGVLCRFTAYVAVDTRTATGGGTPHRVIQPVELPAGWEPMAGVTPLAGATPMAAGLAMAPGGGAGAAATGATPAMMRLPGRAAEREATGGMDPRAVAVTELRRLRELADADPVRRWNALADLLSRLRALLGQLDIPELVKLATGLADCDGPFRPGALDRLWRQATVALERIADGAEDAPPGPPGGGRRRRTTFWKR